MSFRNSLHLELAKLIKATTPLMTKRGLEGVAARFNGTLLPPLVQLIDRERQLQTHLPHYTSAMISLSANQLAALIKYNFQPGGEQRDALKSILSAVHDQVATRLDASTLLWPGLEPAAGEHRKEGN